MPEDDSLRFPGVLGHRSAQHHLARALSRGQLHHALILMGPRGVGKETFARGLACALLCRARPGVGCGECSVCQRALARNHPDLTYLLPSGASGSISVKDARACQLRQANAPYEADAHVIIIDPADALNGASGNALLKAIEEPRDGVHWILLTTNLHGVLPTILSRALPVRLGRLDDGQVRAILERELPDVPAERREMGMLLAEGSAGLAIELARDAALERCIELLSHAITAAARGPAGIFAGDRSPLWTAWRDAVTAAVTAKERAEAETKQAEAAANAGAIKVSGKAKKASKKRAKKKTAKKGSKPKLPAPQQRWVATRLGELWTLHIRQHLRNKPGLPGIPPLTGRSPRRVVEDLAVLRRLATRVRGNANVRLILEQTLLDLG